MLTNWVLLAMMCGSYLTTPVVEPGSLQHEIAPSPYNDKMDALEKEALDQAFRKHMVQLFDVWARESDPDHSRAIAGADKLRRAYTNVMIEIDRRINERKKQ